MYLRSAAEKPRKDSAGFYTLRGRKFPYGNFRTTLERPTVRSSCRPNRGLATAIKKAFSMHHLIEQRIDNGRGYIRAALAASRDDIRRVPADQQLLRLDHVDKSDRHTDDERRRDSAFLNQLMQTDERGRRIADGEEGAGLQIWRRAPSKRLPV